MVALLSVYSGNRVRGRGPMRSKLVRTSDTDFKRQCTQRVRKLVDAAMALQNYNEAAEHFSTILSVDPADRVDILIERSEARATMSTWEGALKMLPRYTFRPYVVNNISNRVARVVKLNQPSYRGNEQGRAALDGMRLEFMRRPLAPL